MVAKIGFWLAFVGSNLVFWVMMSIGVEEMPRRYYDYSQFAQFEPMQQLMTVGAFILGVGFGLTILNWIFGAISGKPAPDNPWKSRSLEWTTATPPPPGNWPEVPIIDKNWHPYGERG